MGLIWDNAIGTRYRVLQPILLGCGLAVLLLAVWATRDRPIRPPARES